MNVPFAHYLSIGPVTGFELRMRFAWDAAKPLAPSFRRAFLDQSRRQLDAIRQDEYRSMIRQRNAHRSRA